MEVSPFSGELKRLSFSLEAIWVGPRDTYNGQSGWKEYRDVGKGEVNAGLSWKF